MKKNIYVLFDKSASCVRIDGCFERDTDALVSFLCRLPNFSLTINSCEVRCIGCYDSDLLSVESISVRIIPWSTLDFSILPDSLVNNLKIAGVIPSDDKDKTISFEYLDKRLSDIEHNFNDFIPVLTRLCTMFSGHVNEVKAIVNK